jgi:hypothetical protein
VSSAPYRRALGELRAVLSAATPTHRHLRDRLVVLWTVTLAVDLVCAGLMFLFERHESQTPLTDLGTALFFSSTQLLTVSSQLQGPYSVPGRVLDVFMEFYAITIVTALAGTFGSFLHRRSRERAVAQQEA